MIDQEMLAAVHSESPGVGGIRMQRVAAPRPAPGELVIKLTHAGLNRHDLFVIDARAEGSGPLVVGSDGIGTVVAAAPDVVPELIGTRVMINPCLGWDRTEDVPLVPEILGDPKWGTLAEYVAVPAANTVPVPAHLAPEEAATLALAGMTVYRALFTVAGVDEGQHVLIPGIGGGVAMLALQFATAAGARVTVTSRRAEVLQRARDAGAANAFATDARWAELVDEPVDVIVDTVGAGTFEQAVRVLRPGGRLVSVGATSGADVDLSLRDLFFRQISISGTSMASAPEFAAMIRFVETHRIRPHVGAVFPLEECAAALAALQANDLVGKIAIEIGTDDSTPAEGPA